MDDKLYELKKDVSTPAGYWRAGAKKTEEEWKREFHIKPDYPFHWCSDWFIAPPEPETFHIDEIKEVVDSVFQKHGLASLTYKDAAAECCREVLKRFCPPNKQKDNGTNT